MQRFTNQKPLEHEYNQLLERLEREEGDLAEFNTQRAKVMQQSEERYRSIFDQSPVGVYIFDKEFKITQWNERIIQILGSSYDRIVGLDTKQIKDQNLIPAMRKALTGEFCNEERLYEATDSAAKLWLSLSLSPLRDADGNVVGGMAVVEDVTERKQVEEKLRTSEERFRLLLEGVKDYAIFMLDPDGYVVSWNEGAERIKGYKAEEIIGKHFSIFYPEEEVEHHKPHQELDIAAVKGRCEDEGWRVRKDGSKFWANVVITVQRDEYGNLRGFSEVTRDITECNIAVERMREQVTLLDKAQDAIIAQDLEHRIIFWNKGAENLYGWTVKEAISKKNYELLYKRGSFQFIEAYRNVIEKGEWMGELHHVDKRGEEIIVESRWTLVRDSEGNPKSVLVIDTNVTERKKLEAQFLRAQRMESVGTLASGIAHDLNNILSPIMMSLQILRKKLTDQNSQRLLNTLETSAQRGADLIRQVLSFARGPEGSRTVLQLRYIISEIEKILRETFPKSIEIRTDIPKDLWAISGDPTQLHQVFMNLCVNARDAISNSGKLSISAENIYLDEDSERTNIDANVGPYVLIAVSDTGTGISPEIMDKIFEPFFTTKEPGKGTGLGLSAAFGIVKGHGGFINVHADDGKGTQFKVYLPAIETNETRKLEEKEPEPPSGRGELILVVDDESSLRDVMRVILERNGYRVITANDGAEAIASYVQHGGEVKAVIIDMVMPIMDGPACVKALHRIDPKVKIIAASGLMEKDKLAEITGLEVEAFLSKPYRAYNLLTTLCRVLNDGNEVAGDLGIIS